MRIELLRARVNHALAGRRLYYGLLGLNLLVALICLWVFRNAHNDDEYAYLRSADGLILTGRYSYWYFWPDYVPDTFRNPGYAFFLVPIRFFTQQLFPIRVVQMGLCLTACWLISQALRDRITDCRAANLFLLLLPVNFQLYYFATQIYPETLGVFLVALYFYLSVRTGPARSIGAAAVLGLIAGCLFQIRPIFLFAPLAHLASEWWITRRTAFRWQTATILLVTYGLMLLPYGIWNKRHHGTFKITPIEGGGGVFQLGFYIHKIPGSWIGRYWSTYTGDEVIKFVAPADTAANLAAYNAEWDNITAELAPLLTPADQAHLAYITRHRLYYLPPTYNSAYTLAREKILVRNTVAHIRAEPAFYLKTRIYTFFRLYFTGIQLAKLHEAHTLRAWAAALFPFVASFATFLLALGSVGAALIRRRTFLTSATLTALLLTLYCGVIHVPFAIQARYTIPVRLLLLFVTAAALAALLQPKAESGGASATG